jgi:hypothetical protein
MGEAAASTGNQARHSGHPNAATVNHWAAAPSERASRAFVSETLPS